MWWSILVILVIGYSGLGLVLYFMQSSFLYSPVKEVTYTPEELDLDFDQVTFKTSDGLKLSGWYIPARNATFTVLFCHGNAGNMMHRLDSINLFNNMNLNCFIFDYRGYGASEGTPTEAGIYLDAKAAYRWLTSHKKVPREKIIIFGRSLGGSIAAHLAQKARAGSLVIESAFTSYVDIGRKFYPYMPVRYFARFNYNTAEYIKNVHIPVMIIHSRNDEVVPFEFALELYETVEGPKKFVEIWGSHNDGFLICSDTYNKAWKDWMSFLTEGRRHKSAGA